MNDLLSAMRISSFEPLLAAYRAAGTPLVTAIDGGAGAGATARQMLEHVEGTIYAFEPFPGNHRFFEGCDERIVLVKEALAEDTKTMSFRIASTVSDDSVWGKRGMTGYSSSGKLVGEARPGDITVRCVRGDAVVDFADFVKLDLQGGELDALRGMSRILSNVALMWIEFSGQPGLLSYLVDNDFLVFDTAYLFMGEPTEEARMIFSVARSDVALSNDKKAWFGFRRRAWDRYSDEMFAYKSRFGLVQTDLACVSRSRLSEFIESLRLASAFGDLHGESHRRRLT